jgi:hypothetical protein
MEGGLVRQLERTRDETELLALWRCLFPEQLDRIPRKKVGLPSKTTYAFMRLLAISNDGVFVGSRTMLASVLGCSEASIRDHLHDVLAPAGMIEIECSEPQALRIRIVNASVTSVMRALGQRDPQAKLPLPDEPGVSDQEPQPTLRIADEPGVSEPKPRGDVLLVTEAIAAAVGHPDVFDLHFSAVRIEVCEERITIAFPSDFVRGYIQKTYRPAITRSCRDALHRDVAVDLVFDSTLANVREGGDDEPPGVSDQEPQGPLTSTSNFNLASKEPLHGSSGSKLNLELHARVVDGALDLRRQLRAPPKFWHWQVVQTQWRVETGRLPAAALSESMRWILDESQTPAWRFASSIKTLMKRNGIDWLGHVPTLRKSLARDGVAWDEAWTHNWPEDFSGGAKS